MRASSAVLIVLGALLLVVGWFALYARQEIVPSETFGDRGVDTLDGATVRLAVRREIVAAVGGGGTVQSQLKPVVNRVVKSDRFQNVFRRAAVRFNRALLVEERKSAHLDLKGVGGAVSAELEKDSPELAQSVPSDLNVDVITVKRDDIPASDKLTADFIRLIGVLLPLLAVILMACGVLLARNRPRALAVAGVATMVAGAALALLTLAARALVVNARDSGAGRLNKDELQDAVGEIYDAFYGDLLVWAIGLGVIGLAVLVAGLAWSGLRASSEAPARA
jgi:hypothetical protein